MTSQDWRKHIRGRWVSFLLWFLLVCSCSMVIAAALLSWPPLYFLAGFPLVTWLYLWRTAKKPTRNSVSFARDRTSAFEIQKEPDGAAQRGYQEDNLQNWRKQVEVGWERQRKIIHEEVARQEQRTKEVQSARGVEAASPISPRVRAGTTPDLPSKEFKTSPAVSQSSLASFSATPSTSSQPQKTDVSIEAIRARIGSNLFEMGMLHSSDSIEYLRREREVERDRQLLAEMERNQASPDHGMSSPRVSPPISLPPSTPSAKLGLRLSVGDIVLHDRFAHGIVTAVKTSGIVTVDFGQLGEKSFSVAPPFDRHFRIVGHQAPPQDLKAGVSGKIHESKRVVPNDVLGAQFSRCQRLEGNWTEGWALDLHTLSSVPTNDGHFDTTRTDLGELLYRLKYRSDSQALYALVGTVSEFILSRWGSQAFAAILPIPPSDMTRRFQPVPALARRIGLGIDVPIDESYLRKVKPTPGLKNIESVVERRSLLDGAFRVPDKRYAGNHVLLFDDLYRSGTTLHAATEVLIQQGGLARSNVYVLTVTKTSTARRK